MKRERDESEGSHDAEGYDRTRKPSESSTRSQHSGRATPAGKENERPRDRRPTTIQSRDYYRHGDGKESRRRYTAVGEEAPPREQKLWEPKKDDEHSSMKRQSSRESSASSALANENRRSNQHKALYQPGHGTKVRTGQKAAEPTTTTMTNTRPPSTPIDVPREQRTSPRQGSRNDNRRDRGGGRLNDRLNDRREDGRGKRERRCEMQRYNVRERQQQKNKERRNEQPPEKPLTPVPSKPRTVPAPSPGTNIWEEHRKKMQVDADKTTPPTPATSSTSSVATFVVTEDDKKRTLKETTPKMVEEIGDMKKPSLGHSDKPFGDRGYDTRRGESELQPYPPRQDSHETCGGQGSRPPRSDRFTERQYRRLTGGRGHGRSAPPRNGSDRGRGHGKNNRRYSNGNGSQHKKRKVRPRTLYEHVKMKPVLKFQRMMDSFSKEEEFTVFSKGYGIRGLKGLALASDRLRFQSAAWKGFSRRLESLTRQTQKERSTVFSKSSKGDSGYRSNSSFSDLLSSKASTRRCHRMSDQNAKQTNSIASSKFSSLDRIDENAKQTNSIASSKSSSLDRIDEHEYDPKKIEEQRLEMTCLGLGILQSKEEQIEHWFRTGEFGMGLHDPTLEFGALEPQEALEMTGPDSVEEGVKGVMNDLLHQVERDPAVEMQSGVFTAAEKTPKDGYESSNSGNSASDDDYYSCVEETPKPHFSNNTEPQETLKMTINSVKEEVEDVMNDISHHGERDPAVQIQSGIHQKIQEGFKLVQETHRKTCSEVDKKLADLLQAELPVSDTAKLLHETAETYLLIGRFEQCIDVTKRGINLLMELKPADQDSNLTLFSLFCGITEAYLRTFNHESAVENFKKARITLRKLPYSTPNYKCLCDRIEDLSRLFMRFQTERTSTVQSIGPDGGVLKLPDCTIYFPKRSVSSDVLMHATLRYPVVNIPNGQILVSPVLCLFPSMKLEAPVRVQLATWLVSPGSKTVKICYRETENSQWEDIQATTTLKSISGQDIIEFEITKFCEYAPYVDQDGNGIYKVVSLLFYDPARKMITNKFSPKSNTTLNSIREIMKQKGFAEVCTENPILKVELKDKIEVIVEKFKFPQSNCTSKGIKRQLEVNLNFLQGGEYRAMDFNLPFEASGGVQFTHITKRVSAKGSQRPPDTPDIHESDRIILGSSPSPEVGGVCAMYYIASKGKMFQRLKNSPASFRSWLPVREFQYQPELFLAPFRSMSFVSLLVVIIGILWFLWSNF